MNLKLKICGMKHPENIQEIAALHPDYMGFIFYEKTPRFFNTEIPKISDSIKKTGVFIESEISEILDKITEFDLNAIQLHGGESAEFCAELKTVLKETNIEIIKVFSVKSEFDFNQLADFEDTVDYFLFDTKGKHKGGNGETFDWTLLKDYPSEKPFFLSGGIGLEQLEDLQEFYTYFSKIGKAHLLYAIDVNSAFENEPGLKNAKKLKQFVDEIIS
ncbi:phosphoribosylanthranilate isomerase [Zunongwangia endophytica]|uniref:N-(5'-phosphoribosyl)anthranilate isomerase n=1 Tax=Zunongwangia endophytica TaxID=1808945 RepID=A0ABV8H5Q9_9FLAO|nr:phosphoribosylanthranilate isomerase [Zunongwangia endophytica]MDN3596580.1 phosphoribosylanthranilate isomerase [Zunongwangia endophytica]